MTQSQPEFLLYATNAEPALKALSEALDDAAVLHALRVVKNQVIGNKHKKLAFLSHGAVAVIMRTAAGTTRQDAWAEAAAALGSLMFQDHAAVHQVHEAQGATLFLHMLASDSDTVKQHAARALRNMCETEVVLRDDTVSSEASAQLLASLMAHTSPAIAAAAAEVVSQVASQPGSSAFRCAAVANALAEVLKRASNANAPAQAPKPLVNLRRWALCALLHIASSPEGDIAPALSCLADIVHAVRSDDRMTRLTACAIIAKLTHASCRSSLAALDAEALNLPQPMGSAADVHVEGGDANVPAVTDAGNMASTSVAHAAGGPCAASGHTLARRLRSLILPVLVQLLAEAQAIAADVPTRLRAVLYDDISLQRAVADSTVLDRLAAVVVAQAALLPTSSEDAMDVEAVHQRRERSASDTAQQDLLDTFHCIELLCSCNEPSSAARGSAPQTQLERCQAAVCAPPAIAAMGKCLACGNPDMRIAVARVFRVLGRSQSVFTQQNLADGVLTSALFTALQSEDREVCTTVCSALNNFVSSPAKQSLLDQGVVPHLAHLLIDTTTEATLGLHSAVLAALCHAVCAASAHTCEQVIVALPWPRMQELLQSEHALLAANAWQTIRNLCHTNDSDKNQGKVLEWAGPELLSLAASIGTDYMNMEEHDSGMTNGDANGHERAPRVEGALWFLSNMATGSAEIKDRMACSAIPALACSVFSGDSTCVSDEMLRATAWLIINLTYSEEPSSEGAQSAVHGDNSVSTRVHRLQQAGVPDALRQLVASSPQDVDLSMRLRTALQRLQGVSRGASVPQVQPTPDAQLPTAVAPAARSAEGVRQRPGSSQGATAQLPARVLSTSALDWPALGMALESDAIARSGDVEAPATERDGAERAGAAVARELMIGPVGERQDHNDDREDAYMEVAD